MARAYFDQNPFGAAPIEQGLDTIRRTYSQKAPSPMDNLSKAIEQPFVENVIVPGISRIRDEMRIAEQEEQIADKAAAARAQGAQLMQQAAAAEQQGLDAEIAAAVSGVNVPIKSLETLPVEGPSRVLLTNAQKAMIDLGRLAAEARAAGRDPVQMVTQGGAWPGHMALLREAGMADVAIEILYGSGGDALGIPKRQLQQTQQRRGEQEAMAAAKQRFGQALVGGVPQVATAEQAVAEQALTPMMVNGRPGVRTRGYEGDEEQGRIDAIATRAYRRALDDGKSREESVAIGMEAAKAAQPEAVAAQAAQEAQAIQQPERLEEANRLRQQATALEAEAKGIDETPVYRDFGSHAMAFLEALETGDVAKQNALMASVGGSVDEQPFGKGAMGKAIGGDAGRSARAKLLDLKNSYLKAQRREKTGMKFIAARKPAPKVKRTGGSGGGSGKKDQVLDAALQSLHRGSELTPKMKGLLKATGRLSEIEVDALTLDNAESWSVLRSRMSKRSPFRNDAATILRSRPTVGQRGVRKLAAEQRAEDQTIKRLKAEVDLATGKAKVKLAAELKAVKRRKAIRSEVRAAQAKLAASSEKVRRFKRAVQNATTAEALNVEKHDDIKGTDAEALKAKDAYADAANAATDRLLQANTELTAQIATEERLRGYLNEAEAKWDALPAASN